MRKGISLHIGVKNIDVPSYSPTFFNPLEFCDADAYLMAALAAENGFGKITTLIDAQATFAEVENHVMSVADELVAGDTFLLTFSGHGDRNPSFDDPTIELDGNNQGWVLYDNVLQDNHLNVLLRLFKTGVRIILVSDSCASASIYMSPRLPSARHAFAMSRDWSFTSSGQLWPVTYRNGMPSFVHQATEHHLQFGCGSYSGAGSHNGSRRLPVGVPEYHYWKRGRDYGKLERRFRFLSQQISPPGPMSSLNIPASVVVLSACQDNENSYEGSGNGYFTRALADAVRNEQPKGNRVFRNYKSLYESIATKVQSLQPLQHPYFKPLGNDPAFFGGLPFTI